MRREINRLVIRVLFHLEAHAKVRSIFNLTMQLLLCHCDVLPNDCPFFAFYQTNHTAMEAHKRAPMTAFET